MSYTADELCVIACTDGHVPQCPRYSRPQTSNDDPAFAAVYPFCTTAGASSSAVDFCRYCHSLEPLHACDTHAMKQRIDDLLVERKTISGSTSDGYHTFDELYEHRIALFVSLCAWIVECGIGPHVWCSRLHSDGTSIDGWFIAGIGIKHGEQITYHLPDSEWDRCSFMTERERAPEWDGHTSEDVVKRLREL